MIWLEQVDTAFKNFFSDIMIWGNKKSNVIISKPHLDFREEGLPCVTIQNIYMRYDNARYIGVDSYVLEVQKDEGVAIVKDTAKPYVLTYQVDFWSNLNSDMNMMILCWLKNTQRKFFNLEVKDNESGEVEECLVREKESLKRLDQFNGEKRLFHSVITFEVFLNLDSGSEKTIPIITTVENTVSGGLDKK